MRHTLPIQSSTKKKDDGKEANVEEFNFEMYLREFEKKEAIRQKDNNSINGTSALDYDFDGISKLAPS